jgi:LytS/YehU family sensor histidine kinase
LFATSIARRVALPWAIAAAAWYFLQRANAREAALRETAMARRRLETGVIEARLQALQAQVEPHFLFNTLAHVRRLYRTNPAQARLMLDSFRAYLLSALPQMRGRAVTLGHELDLVRAYLEVQQVRMGRRLHMHIDASPQLRACEFPSMMLICLVENAIKHGLNPIAEGGEIRVTASASEATIEVCVADSGRGIGDAIGSGTGLANIRGRLAALYGASARLTLVANVPTGVRAMLTLPLRYPPSQATEAVVQAVVTA